jgi:predicted acyl esterase
VASCTSPIHTHGSFEGFRQIATKDKWLRVHNTGEWDDYYNPDHTEDLRKFFDRYLKDIKNDWEKTPRVRYYVLDPGAKDTVDRETTDWPVRGTTFTKFYLQADKTLTSNTSSKEDSLTYEATQTGGDVKISFKVPETTELIGYSKARLWVEAIGSDDMELTVAVMKKKLDGTLSSGNPKNPLQNIAAAGLLRVSHRALDLKKSTESEPFHLHTKEELLKPGEIVPVEIGLWPIGLRFRPGEELVLSIAATTIPLVSLGMFSHTIIPVPADGGTYEPGTKAPMTPIGGGMGATAGFVRPQGVQSPPTQNKGKHVIHFGGKYDSHLLVPLKKA